MTEPLEVAAGLPELATGADLARFLGCSRQAVHKHLARLPASCFAGEKRRRKVRTAVALPLLRDLHDPSRGRGGRPIGPGVPPAVLGLWPDPGAMRALEPTDAASPDALEGEEAAASRDGAEPSSFAVVRQRRELAQAKLAELELARKEGQLVEVATMARAAKAVAARLRQVLEDELEQALPLLRGAQTTDDARRLLPRARDQVLAAFVRECEAQQRELTGDA